MRIEIINWDRYQCRTDVKHTTWFRMQNDFFLDPLLSSIGSDGKMVWLMLLSFASRAQSAVIDIDMALIANILGCEHEHVEHAIKHFQHHGKIKKATLRGRNAHVTRTSRPRTATEQNRTEQDITPPLSPPSGEGKIKPGKSSPPVPPGEQTNQKRKKPSFRDQEYEIVAKAVGAVRNRFDASGARQSLGDPGWAVIVAKFGSWEAFCNAYAIATTQKASGGSDALIFEALLTKSVRALLPNFLSQTS